MLEEVYQLSQRLQPGQRPQLPGLTNNWCWRLLLHRCDPYSGSNHPPDRIQFGMGEVAVWSEEVSFCREAGLTIQGFDYDQFTANSQRAEEGRGTSACAYLQGEVGMRALLGAVELCRADIAALVGNYDRSDRRHDGTIIRTEYNLYSVQHNLPLIIMEGDLANPSSDIATEDRLLKCMLVGHTALTEKNHG